MNLNIIRSAGMAAVMSGIVFFASASASDNHRWQLAPGNSIMLDVANTAKPHADHIEMSGKKAAVVVYWEIDPAGTFSAEKGLVFPLLRRIPNDTHASLMLRNSIDFPSMLRIDNKKIALTATHVNIDGMMNVVSSYKATGRDKKTTGLSLSHEIFPSTENQTVWEKFTARNDGDKPYVLLIPELQQTYLTPENKGVKGVYAIESCTHGAGSYTLQPGDSVEFALEITAYPQRDGRPASPDAKEELAARRNFIKTIDSSLALHTPDPVIDAEFRNAKIRAAESIIKTHGGYMHAPGGESYYAAIWANDQAEYVNPFFPFLGYDIGNESALNSFRHFARYMNPDYKPIPSSIIAEGDDFWNGAGDRGDAAMIAFGAGRYALARGDKKEARELWPLIEWCLEFCRRKVTADGVVASDSDELEGRFPAGDANLCTSSLYYDALLSAASLGKQLGINSRQLDAYRKQAAALRVAIEEYFGAKMKGYHTYRYYDGNDKLRSWICIPLTVGINERADGTVKALFESPLYSADGLLTQEDDKTFWDRSTLYALRGAFAAGYPDRALPVLNYYSGRRLLGDHVPYPIEAWPEGSQRHLSAESGLYCRIITEGLFGIRPTGLRSFTVTPQLPSGWNEASLDHVRAFGSDFNISLHRLKGDKTEVRISGKGIKTKTYTAPKGGSVSVSL